jgi:SAM-dependent methyltransferase
MEAAVDRHLATKRGASLAVLDVGSMDVNGSYRPIFADPAWTYTGLDTQAGPGVDVVAHSPYRWPIPSGSVDVVISGQAFEHIRFPWVTVLEVVRVLRPGGLVVVIAPSAGPEHRYPEDCWRFYPDGMAALAAWADLHVVEAVTYWAPAGYMENSAQWADSVLVAEKPTGAGPRLWRGEAKRWALRQVTRRQAGLRSTAPTPR